MEQEFVTLPSNAVEHALAALIDKCIATYAIHGTSDYMIVDDGKARAKLLDALRAALEQPQVEQPAMTPIAQRKLDSLLAEGYTISGYSVYHEQKHQHGFVTGAGLVGWWRPEGMEYPQPRGEQEPDWSDSKTLPSELWKNPLLSLQERLQIADGAVQWNREVAENLRARLCAAQQPQGEQEPSPTAGMNIAQRILHVGGRNNAAGYVEFGSIQAVEALVRQVLRDLPTTPVQPQGEQEPAETFDEVWAAIDWDKWRMEPIRELVREIHSKTSPQPKRAPLTDEQIDAIADAMPGGLEGFMKGWGWRQFARAVIEATHNIK